MKRVSKLFLILLSIQSGLTSWGMTPEEENVDLLGQPILKPGDLSLRQKLGLDSKAPEAKNQAELATQKQKAMPKKNLPKNKVRALADVALLGKFAQMPGAVWQNHFTPMADHASREFPVSIEPLYNENLVLMNQDRSRAIIKNTEGFCVVNPSKNDEFLFALPGAMSTYSPDYSLVICAKKNKLFVIELLSGKQVLEIARNSIWDDPSFGSTGQFIFMADRGAQNAGIRCFDLKSPTKGDCWVLPEASIYRAPCLKADGSLLALLTRDDAIIIYDTKTKEKYFETEGNAFSVQFDNNRIAVGVNGRIKIFDINDKEKKELFDQPGRSNNMFYPLMLTRQNKVIFQGPDSGSLKVCDGLSGQEIIELKNALRYKLSPDEKFIAVFKGDRGIITSHLYDISSRKELFSGRGYDYCFTPDSNYFVAEFDDNHSAIYNLKTRENWLAVPGLRPTVSSDGRLCALIKVHDLGAKFSMYYYTYRNYSLEITVVDLKTGREISRFESETIPATRAWGSCSFSSDNTSLVVSGYFVRDTVRGSDPKSPKKSWFFDLSFFKDKKFQDAWNNKLTTEQSTLLMLLDEAQKEKNGESISLLRDLALKKMLSLKELQATLASFHPLITQSIIKRYKIIDPTAESIKKAAQDKRDKVAQNKNWMNIAKLSGFATLVGALGAWWYFKKK